MAKAVRKRRRTKRRVFAIPECVPKSRIVSQYAERLSRSAVHTSKSSSPDWGILPPEIIRTIPELLKDDKLTLRACSLAARDFSQPALSCIGRHLTLNHIPRIRLCAQMLIASSAFLHVRSLDLGVVSRSWNPEDYLEEQLIILETFAQRRTLTRLWLSRFPFPSIESNPTAKIRDIVAAFGSTISDLGLYECRFPSYTDLISLIRAFPHCDSLYIRDCVTGGEITAGSVFSGLQDHKLSLDVLELTCASSDRSTIDVSTLIEDACLDISRLSTLICCPRSVDQARSIAISVSASPIHHLQFACTEPGGFRGMYENRMLNCLIPRANPVFKHFSALQRKNGP